MTPTRFKHMPTGPVFGLTLLALLLSGAVMYSRSVRMQRFMEPALALFEPRAAFSFRVAQLFDEELRGLGLAGNYEIGDNMIRVRKSRIAMNDARSREFLNHLGDAFGRMLDDPDVRPNIDVIVVVERIPAPAKTGAHYIARKAAQNNSLDVLFKLFREVPALERDHSAVFISGVVTEPGPIKDIDWVDFIIIPADSTHIELLKRLNKYAR